MMFFRSQISLHMLLVEISRGHSLLNQRILPPSQKSLSLSRPQLPHLLLLPPQHPPQHLLQQPLQRPLQRPLQHPLLRQLQLQHPLQHQLLRQLLHQLKHLLQHLNLHQLLQKRQRNNVKLWSFLTVSVRTCRSILTPMVISVHRSIITVSRSRETIFKRRLQQSIVDLQKLNITR